MGKKRQKLDNSSEEVSTKPPAQPAQPIIGRCVFFLKAKSRYCKMDRAKGSEYCAQHVPLTADGTATQQCGPVRVPCPYDPNHFVLVSAMAKHKHTCNARPKPPPAYHNKGLNLKPLGHWSAGPQPIRYLADLTEAELDTLQEKVATIYNHLCLDIPTSILTHPVCKDEARMGPKHLSQISSLLQHMQNLNLLRPNCCYVEFGAGRGKMTQYIHMAVGDVPGSFIVIDRATSRNKGDQHQLRKEHLGVHFERFQIDIADIDLSLAPHINDPTRGPIVAHGKHLCGGATDLTLAALVDCIPARPSDSNGGDQQSRNQSNTESVDGDIPPRSSSEIGCADGQSDARRSEKRTNGGMESTNGEDAAVDQSKREVAGVMIALCCHHKCNPETYINPLLMEKLGIGRAEFDLLCRMSAWATCKGLDLNMEDSDSEDETTPPPTVADRASPNTPTGDSQEKEIDWKQRQMIGYMCKRIIDIGRIDWLNQRGYASGLVYYADQATTLEHCALWAVPEGGEMGTGMHGLHVSIKE